MHHIRTEIDVRLLAQSCIGYNQEGCSKCTKSDGAAIDSALDFVKANDIFENIWDFRIMSGKKNQNVVV